MEADDRFWIAYAIFNSRWNRLVGKVGRWMINYYKNCYHAYRSVYGKDPELEDQTPPSGYTDPGLDGDPPFGDEPIG